MRGRGHALLTPMRMSKGIEEVHVLTEEGACVKIKGHALLIPMHVSTGFIKRKVKGKGACVKKK